MSLAPGRSCPCSRLLSVSLPGSEAGSPPGVNSCPKFCLTLPARWSSWTWRHPCWLSPSASSLWMGLRGICAGTATVHTMTQIVSTLASSLQRPWHSSHTPATQSALYPLLRHAPAGPAAAGAGLSARPGHRGIPHCVRPAVAALPAGGRQHQSLLLSLSKLMDVKTSSGSCPVAVANLLVSSDHWLADPGWLAGRKLSASPSWASSRWRTQLWWTSSSRRRP